MNQYNRLESALERLYSFIDYEKLGAKNPYDTDENDIRRFRELLRSRGDRHEEFTTVLVAGSKGKGSACAMLEAILCADGRRTGLYTSPHLVDIRERFRLDGACVSADILTDKIDALTEAAVDGGAGRGFRTVFEILTASAFEIFAESGVDVGIIEVGMGGRLDATNAIDPDITAITAIGLDHTHVLGDTAEAIAREKAGILRAGTPLVLGRQEESVRRLILDRAKKIGASQVIDLNDARISINDISLRSTAFDLSLAEKDYPSLEINLAGAHQAENAAVAIALAKLLTVDKSLIYEGLREIRWPGRMQHVAESPDVIIDGAHSPMAFERLIETLAHIRQTSPVWVFAVNRDKDYPAMIDVVRKFSAGIVFTSFDWPRAVIAQELAEIEPSGIVADNFARAIEIARERAGSSGMVVIAGSLYLAGLALKEFGLSPCKH
ncbi:MAG TPA: bifunctional folylpolyglutamate synthase/dihydrofolate synthase [candidate division Zixibacteria bacterium]|nr:bifunctional folylpolyglutamate synthase/dihydrofolate synthase [candidate division Zixibacteria bacterium]